MKNLYAFLPCYNEEKDISELVEKWIQIEKELKQKDYELTVYCIDDKSKDRTNEIIRTLCKKYPDKVKLIEHEVNKCIG